MKRWQKILGGTLVVLTVAGAGTVWHFQNEIQAVQYYLRYTPEEQKTLEADNEKRLEAALQQANLPVELFTDASLTDEERLQKLEALQQEHAVTIMPDFDDGEGQSDVNGNEVHPVPTDQQTNPQKNQGEQTYDAELAAMVGEIYGLRTSFVGQLDGLLQQAKAEYGALSAEERQKQKQSLISKYVGLAGGLESSCDAQMEEILGRMQKHLKKNGGDTSLIKEIRKTYNDEKALKKSYYMSMIG